MEPMLGEIVRTIAEHNALYATLEPRNMTRVSPNTPYLDEYHRDSGNPARASGAIKVSTSAGHQPSDQHRVFTVRNLAGRYS